MTTIPQEGGLDHSLAFVSEGYEFISNRCRRFGSDIFATRLLARRCYCVRGAEAAAMFYEPGRFTRRGALPSSVLHLLQDEGSVAVLDGTCHAHRKAMMMALMRPDRLRAISADAAATLRRHLRAQAGSELVMHDVFRQVLGEAVCRWAGLEPDEADLRDLIAEMGAMIDNAGTFGPPNWIARAKRRHAERLVRDAVEAVRAGRTSPPPDSALHVIAHHRDLDGSLLEADTAAVEMLNMLRPTVAVARFMVFAMLALHENPQLRPRLAADDAYLEAFVQEVRRFYPFFPLVAGKAQTGFSWRGNLFEEGDLFFLDLYGTCHDEASWDEPMAFQPERFLDWPGDPFTMIPQGGGDHFHNHRCAGEWLTIAVMKALSRTLAQDVEYTVPKQDLSMALSHMPALPKSGFVASVTAVREEAGSDGNSP